MPESPFDTSAPTRLPAPAVGQRIRASLNEQLAIKVPMIGAMFWLVKVVTTGMGEAMSDYLATFGVAVPVVVGVVWMSGGLWLQLRSRAYHAPTYWFTVAAVAVFGTVGADGLHVVGLSTTATSLGYAIALCLWMALWYRTEHTLNIHEITTRRREIFYWGTVLLTFALGTALGDWSAFFLGLGFARSIWLYAGLMLIPAIGWKWLRFNAVATFWSAYVLTRPLGASLADWLGKPPAIGLGLGDGTVACGSLVLATVLVTMLWITGADDPNKSSRHA